MTNPETQDQLPESDMPSAQQPHVTRRSLLLAGAATGVVAGVLSMADKSYADNRDLGFAPRTITGYAWPQSVRPGEKIEFKVSTYAPGDYDADLVRLICADAITDNGAHYKEEEVKADFAGTYKGRNQKIHLGSFVEIEETRTLNRIGSFTLAASVYPSRVSTGSGLGSDSFTPGLQESGVGQPQHIISRWNELTKTGWSLAIDEDERVAFYAGDGSGQIDKVVLSRPVIKRRWFQVSVTYDDRTKRLTLAQTPVTESPGDRVVRSAEQTVGSVQRLVQDGVLRFGAAIGGPSNGPRNAGSGVFNGKIDNVRLMRGVLNEDQIKAVFDADEPRDQSKEAIGWWDFAKGTGTLDVHDVSRNALNGTIVNLPERAVMGVRWDGSQIDWKSAPRQYSAIYFHDDDLADCEWQTDFEFVIPSGLRSGIYAARLKLGESEDYIPFYVAPAKSAPKAKVAFVVPTFNYLAYANTLGVAFYQRKVLTKGPDGSEQIGYEEWMPIYTEDKSYVDFLAQHRHEFGYGFYQFHSDGSMTRHATARAPDISNRPKAARKQLTADTDIIEWLEHEGVAYDVITDDLIAKEGFELLSDYQTLITGSHAEYQTWDMMQAYIDYLDQGGRLMSIGGNGFHVVVAQHDQVEGVLECRKHAQGGSGEGRNPMFESIYEFNGRRGGRFREAGFPANKLHGVGTNYPHPQTGGTYYRRLPAGDNPRTRFIFAGISDQKIGDFGKAGGGAASEECDGTDYNDGTPGHALVVARSENMVWPMGGADGLTDPKYRLNFNPRAEMVFFETPNGGAVFSVGSMGYRGSLYHNNFDNNVAKVTKNVLDRFTDPAPFVYPG